MQDLAIGIDLGGTNIKAAVVGQASGLIRMETRETQADRGPVHVLDRIVAISRYLMADKPAGTLAGIGIGAPGSIDWDRTTLIHPPNIPGWGTVNLCEALRRRLGSDLHVVVENDANVAALGSAHFGAGKPFDSFIMVTLGTGVGGAIIYRGRIFRGTTGAAGELGHMTIDYAGPPDSAGVAGAIEAYLGQRNLSDYARRRIASNPDSILHGVRDLNPALVTVAAQDGDAEARGVLEWAGRKLGCILGSCINLLDIRTIVVGGGMSGAGDLILDPARQTVLDFVKPGMRDGVEIVQETRGNEVGMLGAASLVFEHLDTHASVSGG